MRAPRRARPNDHDLARLKEARDILEGLMIQLRPASPEYGSVVNAFDAVRTAAIDWTGNPGIWSGADRRDAGACRTPSSNALNIQNGRARVRLHNRGSA